MKKFGFAVLVIVVAIILWIVGAYNSLITAKENVNLAWGNVEGQYQRRADLVPQLVATTKGAADFEKSTLEEVTQARTGWLDAQNGSVADKMAAGNALEGAMSRLLLTFENYPDLTATENFQTLQAQLEGTENRVAVARGDFNKAATRYNILQQKIPTNIVANYMGLEQWPVFEANEGSENAPTVEFDFDSADGE